VTATGFSPSDARAPCIPAVIAINRKIWRARSLRIIV
jgi:hypothetical protein